VDIDDSIAEPDDSMAGPEDLRSLQSITRLCFAA
jgi:hypothetical protein